MSILISFKLKYIPHKNTNTLILKFALKNLTLKSL